MEESASGAKKLVSTNSNSKQSGKDSPSDKKCKLDGNGEQVDSSPDHNTTGSRPHLLSSLSSNAPTNPLETEIHVGGQSQRISFSILANLDAAWTSKNMPGSTILEINGEVAADSLTQGKTHMKSLKLEKRFEDLGMAEVTESQHPVKGADNSDDNNTGWIGMPLGGL